MLYLVILALQRVRDSLAAMNRSLIVKRRLAESTLSAQSDFASLLIQHLRTPLQPILGLTSILKVHHDLGWLVASP